MVRIKNLIKLVEAFGACNKGVQWLQKIPETKTAKFAWDTCPDYTFMIWLMEKVCLQLHRPLIGVLLLALSEVLDKVQEHSSETNFDRYLDVYERLSMWAIEGSTPDDFKLGRARLTACRHYNHALMERDYHGLSFIEDLSALSRGELVVFGNRLKDLVDAYVTRTSHRQLSKRLAILVRQNIDWSVVDAALTYVWDSFKDHEIVYGDLGISGVDY